MLAIIDHGYANIRAVDRMFRRLNHIPVIATSPADLRNADHVILPGVGSFDAPIRQIEKTGMKDALYEHAIVRQRPLLGICVGMQIMTNGSEEGTVEGLGWVEGSCKKFQPDAGSRLRVPHMGWNKVEIGPNASLFRDFGDEAKFYFVHSYYVDLKDKAHCAATCHYGTRFCASFEKDNLFGVQFHPEKSHAFGMKLLSSFVEF